ncbi:MAG: hypothetical protein J5864_07850, partial [Oscillospiraceae bacterium]|nr:hypothetical protein [Oscillospiraceae bacterium]
SKTEEKEEESKAEETEAVTEAAEDNASTGKFAVAAATSTLTNKLYDVTADYSVPAVDGYDVVASDQTQFGEAAKDYYYYNPKSNANSPHKFNFGVNLFLSDDRSANNYITDAQNDPEKAVYYKTANGYDATISCKEKIDEKDELGNKWEVYFSIYGEKYLDGRTKMDSSFYVHQCDMSQEDVISFVEALVDTVKIKANDAYVTSDNICRMGPHAIEMPVKIKLAGGEYDAEPYLFSNSQFIRINPVVDEVQYEVSTGMMLSESMWKSDLEKDNCKTITLAGKEANIRLDKDKMSINCFADLKIDDKTYLQLWIKSNGLADKAFETSDGKSSMDLFKEMTGENYDATVDLYTSWLDEFVGQMNFTADIAYNGVSEKIAAEMKASH